MQEENKNGTTCEFLQPDSSVDIPGPWCTVKGLGQRPPLLCLPVNLKGNSGDGFRLFNQVAGIAEEQNGPRVAKVGSL